MTETISQIKLRHDEPTIKAIRPPFDFCPPAAKKMVTMSVRKAHHAPKYGQKSLNQS